MKRVLSLVCILVVSTAAFAQQSESTEITTVTTTVSGGEDLMTQLWFMEDATPLETGKLDLRLGFSWVTESEHANLGESSDDFVLTSALVWGAAENLELSLAVGSWLGDGGDVGPFEDGNHDTTVGLLWRIHEQGDECPGHGCIQLPSIALSAAVRIPTGCSSSGMDGELRLVMTHNYDNGIRSHLNAFVKAVDDDNLESVNPDYRWWWDNRDDVDVRSTQWGVVIGADGPLCADGAVRWVADYVHRSSRFDGGDELDILELGWEWTADRHKFGMSVHGGLDHTGENPNFGAGLMYSLSLG